MHPARPSIPSHNAQKQLHQTTLHRLSNKPLQLPQTPPLPRQLITCRRRLHMLKQPRQQPILPPTPQTEKRTRILDRREVFARLVADFRQRVDFD